MCEPVSAISAGVVIGGGLYQAYRQKQEGEYEAEAAKQNQKVGEYAAADAVQRGGQEAARLRRGGSQTVGEQRVALAANGVDLQSGSALDLVSDTAMLAEKDAQTAKLNAAREAWGFKVQAQQSGAQAVAARLRGQQAAAGTLLGTGGQVAGIAGTRIGRG